MQISQKRHRIFRAAQSIRSREISHVFEPAERMKKKTKDREEKLFPRNGNHFSSLTPRWSYSKRGQARAETPTRSLAEIIRHYLQRDGILEKDLFRILNRRLQPSATNNRRGWARGKNVWAKGSILSAGNGSFRIFIGRFNCVRVKATRGCY